MSTGSFLSGFAGGYQSGEGIKDRRRELSILEKGTEAAQNAPTERGVTGGSNGSFDVSGMSERDLLALTLDAEAGGEGYDGMIAAGSVIANRVNSGDYGDGWRGVIMKPGQFSAWNSVTGYAGGEGGLDMANRTASKNAYAAADAILSGKAKDPTGGATHYYNPADADPKWGMRAGGDWNRIGNHVFGHANAGSSRPAGGNEAQPQPEQTAGFVPTVRGVIGAGMSLVDQFYS